MYIVELVNGQTKTEIHGTHEKLHSGKVVKGINCIDSFSFTMLPSNAGFNLTHDLTTLVSVYNMARKRYEFIGRVLSSSPSMDTNGLIVKDVTCESLFGFLCDSEQDYIEEKNWTVRGLVEHIIGIHNAQIEEYKRFEIGEITVSDPNDNVYLGIQRDNTWKTIEESLIGTLGGEIRFRVVDGVTYFDWLADIGTTKETAIRLSRNMKSIQKENDPSSYVTRLIPYGCKLKRTNEDGEEEETEERLTIESVNGGLKYIDDVEAIAKYGIHVGRIELDDVTTPQNLLRKGEEWLLNNNKVRVKYSVSALELALLGIDVDDFDVGNRHPIINPLLSIDDTAKIIKKTVDICDDVKSTIEFGDNFKTLSELQLEQSSSFKSLSNTFNKAAGRFATNQQLNAETKALWAAIPSAAEKGSDGIWSYEKDSLGRCELWGVVEVTDAVCSTAFGNLYKTDNIEVDAFPFDVTDLKIVASYDGEGMLCAASAEAENAVPSYYLAWIDSATISGRITLHAVGAWK